MNDDWRLDDQLTYLHGKKIKYASFHTKGKNDHEHCEFCWEKISELPGTQHFGYCTLDRYYWICTECFNDFKDMFQWTLVPNPNDE